MNSQNLRFFNTTGPCNPEDHYMLPPAERLQGAQLDRYIRHKLYWVLHAPRQTGKTTFLQSWMREINAGDDALACYVSVERCQGFAEVERAAPEMCTAIQEFAKWQKVPVPAMPQAPSGSLLSAMLADWAELVKPKALVVLFDEVDVLQGETLISFLRQLRGGFAARAVGKFPVSIALVGMRDLKDYITAAKDGVPVNPGSPFNIKEDSAIIGNFSPEDVARLFAQRTKETGQQITQDALAYVYDQSRGQPWIVNNLFKRATMRVLTDESKETVSLAHVQKACEQMILARETHLDALAYRLDNPEIRNVMETLLTGKIDMNIIGSEASRLCQDLGLIARYDSEWQVANPIYREVLARQMTYSQQEMLPPPRAFRWQAADGSLDMNSLLKEFQTFWRENSAIWEQTSDYTEAFPHLLLMAFLQRLLNGGGNITREYAAGRGRLDLLVEYSGKRYIIEVKLLRDLQTPESIRAKGLSQIRSYRDTVAPAAPCYLVIFDRRTASQNLSWDQRITWETDQDIQILGC